jgi:hypothetical protein
MNIEMIALKRFMSSEQGPSGAASPFTPKFSQPGFGSKP